MPWVQPWGTAATQAPLAMPPNAATGCGYSGINVLILWGAVIEHGFSGQSWLTFRQALSFGGNVRKGERGTTVVYADRVVPDDEKLHARETGENPQAIPFLTRFTVFNAAQCENLPALSRHLTASLKTAGATPGILKLNCGHYSLSRPPNLIWARLSVLRLLSRSQRSVL